MTPEMKQRIHDLVVGNEGFSGLLWLHEEWRPTGDSSNKRQVLAFRWDGGDRIVQGELDVNNIRKLTTGSEVFAAEYIWGLIQSYMSHYKPGEWQ